jgi:DNA-binding transcriptional MerR regulator
MTDDMAILSAVSTGIGTSGPGDMLAGLADASRSYTITDLAEAFAITPRSIRFYEDEGLIAPERRGQSRIYSARDVARLAWVLRGKRVGFSLADIREMLDLYDAGDGRASQRAITLEKCRARLATLEAQRADLDHVITELDEFCTTIDALVLPKTKR